MTTEDVDIIHKSTVHNFVTVFFFWSLRAEEGRVLTLATKSVKRLTKF